MGSDYRTLRLFVASFIISAVIVVSGLMVAGHFGYANQVSEVITGHGTLDARSYSAHSSDTAMAQAANIMYQYQRDWADSVDQKQVMTSSFIVSGARGGYRNQYVVTDSGAGYKHFYQATKITGEFSGSMASTVAVVTGLQSLDSLVLMDGNATFSGRVINGTSGRPVDEKTLDAMGQFMIRSYVNITQPAVTPEDWLGFCSSINTDAPEGLLVVPAGSYFNPTTKQVERNVTT
jgi:hypothetical protein